jgi:hypothetical protein
MDSNYPLGQAYLPLGGHLLPYEFQNFLIEWNMAISATSPEVDEDAWKGESRRQYQKDHPELWESYMAEFRRLNTLYSVEVKALKEYQKAYKKVEELEDAVAAAQEERNKRRANEEEIAHRSSLSYANMAAAAAAAAADADAEESVLYPLPFAGLGRAAHGGQDAQDAYADEVGCGCCPPTAGKGWCAKCKDEERSHCEC